MAGKENPRTGWAHARATELEIESEGGTSVAYEVNASDENAATSLINFLEDSFGLEVEILEKVPSGNGRKSFFYGSKKWKSPWEPKGPRRPWIDIENPLNDPSKS